MPPARLNLSVRIGFEVPVPRRMLRLAVIGGADYQIFTIVHIEERVRARLPGFSSSGVQEQHRIFELFPAKPAIGEAIDKLGGSINNGNKGVWKPHRG
jgi:hypothetical protein